MLQEKRKYISTAEAAKILGISRMQVIRNIRKGKIKAERIGRNFVISIDELNPIFRASSKDELAKIDRGVEKVVQEYSEALKKLGRE